MRRARRHWPAAPRQRGVYIVIFALVIVVVIGFIGMALDLGQIYARRTALQNAADSAALATARSLDGTGAGITAAVTQGIAAAKKLRLPYAGANAGNDAVLDAATAVTLTRDAFKFSTAPDTPDGAWLDEAGAIGAGAANLYYAKVDTRDVAALGLVNTAFIAALPGGTRDATTFGRAVAGRSSMKMLPLGICALNQTPGQQTRTNSAGAANAELIEWGFRRGVGYNLMQLNPLGTTPVNYLINPIDPASAAENVGNYSLAIIKPHVCTGSVPLPSLGTPPAVFVNGAFPLAAVFQELNSRFDQYAGSVCNRTSAPPDRNIRVFFSDPSYIKWWMGAQTVHAAVPSPASTGSLLTIADMAAPPNPTVAANYGPLWSYAIPVKAVGGANFTLANWSFLYPPNPGPPPSGPVAVSANYPSIVGTQTSPYKYSALAGANANHFTAASSPPGLSERRVLYVPLLACPVTGNTANVLAIGKFLMTSPATATALYGEFGGLVSAADAASAANPTVSVDLFR